MDGLLEGVVQAVEEEVEQVRLTIHASGLHYASAHRRTEVLIRLRKNQKLLAPLRLERQGRKCKLLNLFVVT